MGIELPLHIPAEQKERVLEAMKRTEELSSKLVGNGPTLDKTEGEDVPNGGSALCGVCVRRVCVYDT